MVISPLPSQELETKLFMGKAATRKRKLSSGSEQYETMKKSILNNDVEKLNLFKAIDSKLERAISIFERVADDQSKILSLIIQQNQNQAYLSMPFPLPPSHYHPILHFIPHKMIISRTNIRTYNMVINHLYFIIHYINYDNILKLNYSAN